MARATGVKNRNYPSRVLEEALVIPRAIQEQASGMAVSKLTLAGLVDSTPSSSTFRGQLLSARAYGLTEGGVNANEFSLTDLGIEATSDDSSIRTMSQRRAVLNIEPFREFFTQFNGKKVPAKAAFSEFLISKAKVPSEWAEECMKHIVADGRHVGFFSELKGSDYVVLNSPDPLATDDEEENIDDASEEVHHEVKHRKSNGSQSPNDHQAESLPPSRPMSIFVAHGKDRKPLEQLKSLLKELGVPFKVAVDEPHAGRPVGEKVATMMRNECSSAVCIFSADERFLREDEEGNMVEVWRPSENAVYELGAASVLYGRRVILFKEDKVALPSDFRDIGHITFKSEEIHNHMLELLRELKAHGLVEVVVPG